MNRRQLLQIGSVAIAASPVEIAFAATSGCRFVHFTETHIQGALRADEGVAKRFGQIAELHFVFAAAT